MSKVGRSLGGGGEGFTLGQCLVCNRGQAAKKALFMRKVDPCYGILLQYTLQCIVFHPAELSRCRLADMEVTSRIYWLFLAVLFIPAVSATGEYAVLIV